MQSSQIEVRQYKRRVNNIKKGETIKMKDGRKGVVKREGRLDGNAGFVLGVDVFLGKGQHDGDYNGVNIFRPKPGQGAWVRHAEVSHVYRDNPQTGKTDKIRYVPITDN